MLEGEHATYPTGVPVCGVTSVVEVVEGGGNGGGVSDPVVVSLSAPAAMILTCSYGVVLL